MKYLKAKYCHDGQVKGRAYTFKTAEEVTAGTVMVTPDGKHVQVVNEPVDTDWVNQFGAEKIVELKIEEEKKND